MKTFEQLTEPEKEAAVHKAIESLMEAILEGAVRFNDLLNGDDLQERIDAACAEAEILQTPWFAGEIIMERAGEDIRLMAQCDAEDALYSEPWERVVTGVAK